MNSVRLPEVRGQDVTCRRGQVEIHVQSCAIQNLQIHTQLRNLEAVSCNNVSLKWAQT